ncbi:Plasmodium exported protein (PHISTa-like), putative [Plasmodium sp. DRC-Itaito]|nr:Plasmodium exported protein (PHISTa-like), putative [Plasmodium sp. DRC-Itaito]
MNSLEHGSLEIVKNGNVKENRYSTNNDLGNTNMKNKCNSSISNINYNDMSKSLTEKELYDILNSLKECPLNQDLRNI